MKLRILRFVLGALFCAAGLIAQDAGVSARKQAPSKAARGQDPNTFVLVGAGDIAWCGNLTGAEATAKLIDKIAGTVFAAGDLAYNNGTYEEFEDCYQPTWGRFKKRTNLLRGTMSTMVRMLPAIFDTGARRPAIPRPVTTVSTLAPCASSL